MWQETLAQVVELECRSDMPPTGASRIVFAIFATRGPAICPSASFAPRLTRHEDLQPQRGRVGPQAEDREGWKSKDAWVGHHIGSELIGGSMYELEPGNKLWPFPRTTRTKSG